ncbi:aminotransferase class I/II-fold pyridoxal phosphate-dependent enzyme [Flavobacteriaceae bacterium AU392]|nr:aminotransferase class I/II-fold pyridoxal phosphate-dependent enzyme [Flavobacteriaceae bacterium]RKM84877.1 aminotransferase class I/II-fold pyridoxal phosphate-dependent enzyme [Flavobacteriaceae bacterium AU392]
MLRIALSKSHLSGYELPYIKKAFDNNQISIYGENLSGFENDLEEYLQKESHISCTISGTAAIHLALILSGVEKGDEVLCQSMTYSASANPILYQGAHPVFIGSEKNTWNMCPEYLEEAIKDRISKGKKPKAIIVVHLYGMPARMDEIVEITKRYEILLIEDAAEALGSTYKGRKCGTFGDFGILSFNGNKIITTSGGGALICKNEKLKNRAIFLATQAKDNAVHYQHSEIGYNYRMNNVIAGIGRGQMKVLDEYVKLRRNNHEFYAKFFKNINGITVFKEPNEDYFSNHWLNCIIIDEKKLNLSREDMRLGLLKRNIESRPLWKPMHLQPVFKKVKFYGSNVSEQLFNIGLCLPSGSNLSESDKDYITKVLNLLCFR